MMIEIRQMPEHGCEVTHRTWTALARCRWPNHLSLSGNGQYLVVIEDDHSYQSGVKAYWPELCLFSTAAAARKFAAGQHARLVRVYEFPSDPREATYAGQPFTQAGNRERYGEDGGSALEWTPELAAKLRKANRPSALEARAAERNRQFDERKKVADLAYDRHPHQRSSEPANPRKGAHDMKPRPLPFQRTCPSCGSARVFRLQVDGPNWKCHNCGAETSHVVEPTAKPKP